MIRIDHQLLNDTLLDKVLTIVVSRAGLDYGETDCPLEVKKIRLHQRLRQGQASIIYDAQQDMLDIVDGQVEIALKLPLCL